MVAFLIVLIILAALGILGAVIKGFLWLTAIAFVLFIGALVYGWTQLKSRQAS